MKNIQGINTVVAVASSSSSYIEMCERKKGESIHSGQFMVSHIENNEEEDEAAVQDQQIIDMLTSDADEVETVASPICTDLQPYQHYPVTSQTPGSDLGHIIDTDLSTVFKTLNVTYNQKLTSPKWNAFKGIRLRWKEKIRLNNVIWRCWHMQFIMKKKTLVCQFASPLDVDIHNTPTAILLEGKYWKRKIKVIISEYIRWRKYNIKAAEAPCILDTKSEIDFVEWSTQGFNDDLCTLTDGMSSDTLFSSVSQFSFPDSREIARAGRADFIQPSLEPLQPNIDDFMDLDIELFNYSNNRLPPVPEEETEYLKAIDCNFPMIDQQQLGYSGAAQSMLSVSGSNTDPDNAPMSVDHAIDQQQYSTGRPTNSQGPYSTTTQLSSIDGTGSDSDGGYMPKNKLSRGYYKPHRREPINYDKQQPTKHQTTIYNQMIAQQQQPPMPPPQTQAILNVQSYTVPPSYPPLNVHVSPIQTTTNNYNQMNTNQTLADVINLSNSQQQMVMQQMSNEMQQPMAIIQNQNTNFKPPIYVNQQGYKPQQQSYQQDTRSQNEVYMQAISSKEMFRSNSLPINATMATVFPQATAIKEEQFVVPKHPRSTGTPRSRVRSNSINLQKCANQLISGLQSANSEPLLNVSNSALLAQLLNTSSNLVTTKSSSAIGSAKTINTNKSHAPKSTQQQQPHLRTIVVSSAGTSVNSSSSMQHKSLTFPAPAVQNLSHHQSASTGMPTSVLTNLKMHLQQQQQQPPQPQPSLAFSSASHTISTPSMSPDSALDVDVPLSPPNHPTRRQGHIHAEQKRRCNIKNGFDMLHSLIPELQQNPNAKLSKAAMLHKGAEYIQQMEVEKHTMTDKIKAMRQEIDSLTNSLNHLQSILPANGAPVSRQKNERMAELYHQLIRTRTSENWKYWFFGLIFEPMMNSFNQTVSVASVDDLYRTTHNWVDQHCSLIELRPAVSNKLRILSTTTDLLSDSPSSLQDEARKAMSTSSTSSSKSSSSGYQSRS